MCLSLRHTAATPQKEAMNAMVDADENNAKLKKKLKEEGEGLTGILSEDRERREACVEMKIEIKIVDCEHASCTTSLWARAVRRIV